jgi:hypothetical protein
MIEIRYRWLIDIFSIDIGINKAIMLAHIFFNFLKTEIGIEDSWTDLVDLFDWRNLNELFFITKHWILFPSSFGIVSLSLFVGGVDFVLYALHEEVYSMELIGNQCVCLQFFQQRVYLFDIIGVGRKWRYFDFHDEFL